MFGIPGKQAVTMTDKAAAQIIKLMTTPVTQVKVLRNPLVSLRNNI